MDIIIIGGGASGTMAAIVAKQNNNSTVTLLEKNEKIGKKLYLTGKGRCNVTNDCDKEVFMHNVVSNPKFLFAAINAFDSKDTMSFFEKNGCALKTERGNRVFPASDKSSDIIKCLKTVAENLGVIIKYNTTAKKIEKLGSGFCVKTNNGDFVADKVVVATGGCYYSSTGSNGEGYVFAKEFGHSIVKPKPSLIGFVTKEKFALAGLSLKNVELTLKNAGKVISTEFGEMLFTHNGISGPIAISLSAIATKFSSFDATTLSLDLKPALSFEQLDKRILRDFETQKNKQFKNSLYALVPSALADYLVAVSGINSDKEVNAVSKQERKNLCELIKALTFNIGGFEDADTAIVTSGGVCVKEINPNTMESKLAKGLYFCGEVLDVDALTGGFNLQIAFSTAVIAGKSASQEEEKI